MEKARQEIDSVVGRSRPGGIFIDYHLGLEEEAVLDMDEGPGRTLPRAHSLVCIPVSRPSPFLAVKR
uniref:Uncharacterized protein n=1 Tax=Salix viminalis TaxID=40686 RepID=A0A6N2N5U3_SALVM